MWTLFIWLMSFALVGGIISAFADLVILNLLKRPLAYRGLFASGK